LGIGDWGLGPIPNPQSPIPNPHNYPKNNVLIFLIFNKYNKLIYNFINKNKNGKIT